MATRRGPQMSRNFKKSGKKPLPEPTHVGHFISILVMSLCKKVLHIDTAVKVGIYVVGTLIGSIISDIFAFPKTYFADKRNLLNKVFVGFGFGWTLMLLTSFIFLTSFVFTCGDIKTVIRKHLLRLGLATLWWYLLTTSFRYIDSVVGVCSNQNLQSKGPCLRAGKAWLGFDISGHVFLLIHNLLTISEEVKLFKDWTGLEAMLNEEDIVERRNLTEHQISQARVSYKTLTPYIKINILLLALWTVFCEFMLIISVVYRFHTLTQKIMASFLAVGCWFVSYRLFFQTGTDVLPCPPGESSLNFVKGANRVKAN